MWIAIILTIVPLLIATFFGIKKFNSLFDSIMENLDKIEESLKKAEENLQKAKISLMESKVNFREHETDNGQVQSSDTKDKV